MKITRLPLPRCGDGEGAVRDGVEPSFLVRERRAADGWRYGVDDLRVQGLPELRHG